MGNSLIVGGAGFIGSQLCDALLEKGEKVIVLDNFLRGKKENLALAEKSDRFVLVEGDAADTETVARIIREHSIDYIYHLAANSDIQASASDPSIEFECTAKTTWSILMAMRQCNVKNLFFSSTSAVYGPLRDEKGFTESSLPNPVSYYGSAKAASEAFIRAFAFMNDLNVLIFRFPNVIGRRLTHGVIFDFISRLRKNPNMLEVLGDGTQYKPYLHCDDLIRAIVAFAPENKGVNVYQVGVEDCTYVRTIAEIVVEEMGLKESCQICYGKDNVGWKGDVPHFAYDLSKIHNAGWKASMSSDDAVRLTVREALKGMK